MVKLLLILFIIKLYALVNIFGHIKNYFYTKHESYQGLQTFLVGLKSLIVLQLPCLLLDKHHMRNKYYRHKLVNIENLINKVLKNILYEWYREIEIVTKTT